MVSFVHIVTFVRNYVVNGSTTLAKVAVENVDGDGEHYLGAADEAVDAIGLVGAMVAA